LSFNDHFKVAIIGAGPAGIGVAVGLAKQGIHPVVLIERRSEIGGIPARYKEKDRPIRTFVTWRRVQMVSGEKYVNQLKCKITKTDVQIWLESQVLTIDPDKRSLTILNPDKGKLKLTADAIILACGSREKSLAERGWIAGSRSARILFSNHLVGLLDRHDVLPCHNPAIIGSDLVAYASAAKLKNAGAFEATMIDASSRPKCSLPARIYFRRWTRPDWRHSIKSAEIVGQETAEINILPITEKIICDGILVSGELIPNSELAILGGLEVDLISRRLILNADNHLSAPGWFATGNILGSFHGAEWCYSNGLEVARFVIKYLSNS